MFRHKLSIVALSLTAFALAGCQVTLPPAPPPARQKLVFMAGYKPQANLPFVGAYVAKEKGFFEAEGLDVTIEHSPGQGQHIQLLMSGQVHVTTSDAAVVLQRRADPGLPLVSIALIGQRGQQAFVAKKASGMTSPKDWEGKLVGYKGTPPPDLFALLNAAGADVNKVQLVNVGFDPRVLVEGKVDVYPVFKSNEPYLLTKKLGQELVIWDAADYGVPTLGLTYVTSEAHLAERPEAIRRFVRAALRGIEYARQNVSEAVQIVLKYTGPEADPNHMRYMLETELRDAFGPYNQAKGIGWQTKEQWEALAKMLQQYNALGEVDVSKAFTTALLEDAP
ncbi:MAG: ABC transporter substrate-binding protein [Thermoflexales bacterium]|nr:ABC transporter substrate-binding protein [Thermoflexales bacterium]MCS7323773.1 ABC transporter substrate-binding protein [Thermoflexales bacterium]MDW8054204.1 ABC transporter substrate-binding protein [Anaerolineae bacterium]MDW8292276.1 ABC transporter substrate-binding protein [Anaerolineae bacterium]